VTTALLLHGLEVVLPEGTELEARVGATTTLHRQAEFFTEHPVCQRLLKALEVIFRCNRCTVTQMYESESTSYTPTVRKPNSREDKLEERML